jgi:hypothetical protein
MHRLRRRPPKCCVAHASPCMYEFVRPNVFAGTTRPTQPPEPTPPQTCAWASPAHRATSARRAAAPAAMSQGCAMRRHPRPTARCAALAPARAACAQVSAGALFGVTSRGGFLSQKASCMHRLRRRPPKCCVAHASPCMYEFVRPNVFAGTTRPTQPPEPTPPQTCAWASPAHRVTSARRAAAHAAMSQGCATSRHPRPTARCAALAPARAACAQVGACFELCCAAAPLNKGNPQILRVCEACRCSPIAGWRAQPLAIACSPPWESLPAPAVSPES